MKRVISFHYTLTGKDGQTIDSSGGREPTSYLEGSHQIIPGLEKELAVLNPGEKKTVNVAAAEAYGIRDEKRVLRVPRENLPQGDIKTGDRFQSEDGHQVFTVVEVSEKDAVLDGNHPLAGQALCFNVEVTEIREATEDELGHGHVHGPGGHH